MSDLTCSACGAVDHALAAHFDLETAQHIRLQCTAANDTGRALAWQGVIRKLEYQRARGSDAMRGMPFEQACAACSSIAHDLAEHVDLYAARLAHQQLTAAGDLRSAAHWGAAVDTLECAAQLDAQFCEVFGP